MGCGRLGCPVPSGQKPIRQQSSWVPASLEANRPNDADTGEHHGWNQGFNHSSIHFRMTLSQIAREWCANWQSPGFCLGATIEDDGSIRRCSPKPKCELGSGKRCGYFEECVMPMESRTEWPGAGGVKYGQEFAEACRQYRQQCNIQRSTARACPGCNRALAPRARMCPSCRKKARQATWRKSTEKRRCPVNS